MRPCDIVRECGQDMKRLYVGASNGWEQAMGGSKLWVGASYGWEQAMGGSKVCGSQSMIFDHFRSSFLVISVCGSEHVFRSFQCVDQSIISDHFRSSFLVISVRGSEHVFRSFQCRDRSMFRFFLL